MVFLGNNLFIRIITAFSLTGILLISFCRAGAVYNFRLSIVMTQWSNYIVLYHSITNRTGVGICSLFCTGCFLRSNNVTLCMTCCRDNSVLRMSTCRAFSCFFTRFSTISFFYYRPISIIMTFCTNGSCFNCFPTSRTSLVNMPF